jgi:hypothetical protein
MDASNDIQLPSHQKWMILAYAGIPLPFYAYFIGMSSWNTARDEFVGWDLLLDLLAFNLSLACAFGVTVYLWLALRTAFLHAPHVFREITKIHLRAFFGSTFTLLVPVSLTTSSIETIPKIQERTADVFPDYVGSTLILLPMIVLNLVILFAFISWGRSLVKGIPRAVRRLTDTPFPSEASS